MKLLRALAAACLCAALCGAAWVAWRTQRDARSWEAWFENTEVPEFRLSIDQSARAALAVQPREHVRAVFEHDGQRMVVGVRLKGHRSMRALDGKAAFKIAFDRYEPGQRFLGVRRLTLNNMVEDASSLREALAYRVFRALGVESPRTGYARLSVDGVPFGLYLMVEAASEVFRRADSEQGGGVVYEGEYGCDLVLGDVDGFELDRGEDAGRSALRALAGSVAHDPKRLFDAAAGPLDMPAFLDFLAASTLVGDFDGYYHSHNYRVRYLAEPGRWQLAPWGLDRVFQRHILPFDSKGLLAKLCFADRACRLEYVRRLRAATDRFEALELVPLAQRLARLIEPFANEGFPDPEGRDRIAARQAVELFIAQRPARVRAQIGCIDPAGNELDRDADHHGCMDCDDADPSVGPHAEEVCGNGVDDDCSGIIDDAVACDCERQELSGRVYHLCNWPMPWEQAARICNAKGLALVRLDSRAESKALYATARRFARDAWWIGYSDRDREGAFRWSDGESGSFTYWDKGQPNNQSCNENCAAFREGRRGKWHDTPCNRHLPFICSSNEHSSGTLSGLREGRAAGVPNR